MKENNNTQNEYNAEEKNSINSPKSCSCNKHTKENWLKFALTILTILLGIYLASYYVLDQIRDTYYLPSNIRNIDKIIKEQDKIFKDMKTLPLQYGTMINLKTPIETYYDDKKDEYKIVIDLQEFDNNPDNVKLEVKGNEIKIFAQEITTNNNSQKTYKFAQSFVLPDNINPNLIKKEVKNNTYTITLPIED